MKLQVPIDAVIRICHSSDYAAVGKIDAVGCINLQTVPVQLIDISSGTACTVIADRSTPGVEFNTASPFKVCRQTDRRDPQIGLATFLRNFQQIKTDKLTEQAGSSFSNRIVGEACRQIRSTLVVQVQGTVAGTHEDRPIIQLHPEQVGIVK